MTEQTESLLTALKAIAGMQVSETTNHAQLSALCIAIAKTELQKFCCGDAACFNESSGVPCAAWFPGTEGTHFAGLPLRSA